MYLEITGNNKDGRNIYSLQDIEDQDLYLIASALTSLEAGVINSFTSDKAAYLLRIKFLLNTLKTK